MALTTLMRDALQRAEHQPLRRIHDDQPGRPHWPAHPMTLHALVRHDCLLYRERLSRRRHRIEEWAITKLGVTLLYPPPVLLVERPVFLSRQRGDYTTDPSLRIDDLEVMHDDLPPHWRESAYVRHEAARSADDAARELAALLRAA